MLPIIQSLESEQVEKVNFLRDEMANLYGALRLLSPGRQVRDLEEMKWLCPGDR